MKASGVSLHSSDPRSRFILTSVEHTHNCTLKWCSSSSQLSGRTQQGGGDGSQMRSLRLHDHHVGVALIVLCAPRRAREQLLEPLGERVGVDAEQWQIGHARLRSGRGGMLVVGGSTKITTNATP